MPASELHISTKERRKGRVPSSASSGARYVCLGQALLVASLCNNSYHSRWRSLCTFESLRLRP